MFPQKEAGFGVSTCHQGKTTIMSKPSLTHHQVDPVVINTGDTHNFMGNTGSNTRHLKGVVVTLIHKVHRNLNSFQLVWRKLGSANECIVKEWIVKQIIIC